MNMNEVDVFLICQCEIFMFIFIVFAFLIDICWSMHWMLETARKEPLKNADRKKLIQSSIICEESRCDMWIVEIETQ